MAEVTRPVLFEDMEELVYYDGPLLGLWVDGYGFRVGITLNEHGDRWLLAEVTIDELEALGRGELPMRAPFERDPRAVFQFRDGVPDARGRGPVTAFDIPDGFLPVPGAPLPDGIRGWLLEFCADDRLNPRSGFEGG